MASSNDTPGPVPPEEFKTVIRDFISDIHCAFPEYDAALSTYSLVEVVENMDGTTVDKIIITDANYGILYDYCRHIYPSRFFDILYKNEKMFMDTDGSTSEQNELNTEFLPNIDFKMIWKMDDISDNTKDTLWKYLQLILFSVVNNMSDTGSFGDTAKLFEAIDEKELKSKLEEVIDNMNQLFGDNNGGGEGANVGGQGQNEAFEKASEFMKNFMPSSEESTPSGSGGASSSSSSSSGVPNPETIHQHLSGLLGGKIGKLAKEIAEETAQDLDIDMSSQSSVTGVFQQLFKNPGKLTGLVKSVGEKLDKKLKSGELKESEIMQEASDLMSKMKSMPGMGNIASMLSQMGMQVPGGGKVNMGAMQSHLQRNIRQAKMRERLLRKMNDKTGAGAGAGAGEGEEANVTSAGVFTTGEKPERTPRFKNMASQHAEFVQGGLTAKDLEEDVDVKAADNKAKKKSKSKNKK